MLKIVYLIWKKATREIPVWEIFAADFLLSHKEAPWVTLLYIIKWYTLVNINLPIKTPIYLNKNTMLNIKAHISASKLTAGGPPNLCVLFFSPFL